MSDLIYPSGCKEIHVELTNDELIRRLKKIQQAYQDLGQNSTEKYQGLSIYLGSEIFLEHEHEDVKLLVACCLADIFRINAPDSPFQDSNNLKKIFLLLASQLKGLKDTGSSFKYYSYLLENICAVNTFTLCMELEDSQEVIVIVFENAFKIINEKTNAKVKALLFDMLNPLLNEPEQISTKVLDILLARIIEPQKSNNKDAYALAVNLIKKGNEHFEYFVQNHLNNILVSNRGASTSVPAIHASSAANVSHDSDDDSFLAETAAAAAAASNTSTTTNAAAHSSASQFISDKLCLIIYELNVIRYALLELVMPQLEYKLRSAELKERREYTKLLSKMFSEKESRLSIQLPQLWEAYLDRFADANEEIRHTCVQYICDFLVQQADSIQAITSDQPGGNTTLAVTTSTQLEQIIEQVKSRSLDPEESIRHEVVQEILKAIKMEHNLITIDLLNILKDRTLDVKIKVRKSALQGLAALYKKIHSKATSTRKAVQVVSWIPSKIMRIYFQDSSEDKLLVERLLNNSIVPYNLGVREKMAQLYYAFTTFDEYSWLSLAEIMKNRIILYQLMKFIIDAIEASPKGLPTTSRFNADILLVAQQLLDVQKGQEFMKAFAELLKTNVNLRKYFKNLIQFDCSFNKSMQLIQLIFANMNTLNQAQVSLGKRLIERMSSIIIDQDSVDCLIELIGYKIRQKLTLKQRRLLSKQQKKKTTSAPNSGKGSKRGSKNGEVSDEEEDEEEENEEDEDQEENKSGSIGEDEDEEAFLDDDDEADKSATTVNDRVLLRHIDDDGEKGLKLLNMIFMIHNNYHFNNASTYESLFTFVNSRKDHISSYTLKMLGTYFTCASATRQEAKKAEPEDLYAATNEIYLDKLRNLCMHGKPKQAKHAVHLIFKNVEKPRNATILAELYKDLTEEALLKNSKNFVTCLISIGHICQLIPHLVGKEAKDFISKTICREILYLPSTTQLNLTTNEMNVSVSKRKVNLKLSGKWCENEDELPFSTRTRIESIKLIVRWCIGLGKESNVILLALKILIRILRENSMNEPHAKKESDETATEAKNTAFACEAEMSRVRVVCGSQLIKLAQHPAFKSYITPEYFHIMAKLIIDPVTNVRDIIIKKLHKGLKSGRLSFCYASIFALCGLDPNRERRVRVRKIFTSLAKTLRANEAKNLVVTDQAKPRVMPEMCLSYAVSLIAHSVRIESLQDEPKVKQIKECMAIILEPLVESPDAYQIAYIRKLLNKIKTHDDGLSAVALINRPETATAEASSSAQPVNNTAIQNLYHYNKVILFVCEIFLFFMHSKSASYMSVKDNQFEVKLPAGFFAPRGDNNDSEHNEQQQKINKELAEHFRNSDEALEVDAVNNNDEELVEDERDIREVVVEKTTKRSATSSSRIEISKVTRKRRADTSADGSANDANSSTAADEAASSHNNSKASGKSNNSSAVSEENVTLEGILKNKKAVKAPQAKRNKVESKSNESLNASKSTAAAATKKPRARATGKKAGGGRKKAETEDEETEDEKENDSGDDSEQEEETEVAKPAAKKGANKSVAKAKTPAKSNSATSSSDAVLTDSPAGGTSTRPRRAAAARK